MPHAKIDKVDIRRDTKLGLYGVVVVSDGFWREPQGLCDFVCRLGIKKEPQDLELARRQGSEGVCVALQSAIGQCF